MNASNAHIAPEVSVISTQPVEQSRKLELSLTGTSIAFFNMPMIRTEHYSLNNDILKRIENLSSYQWLIFTSKNGVSSFFYLLQEAGLSLPANLKTAVIGKATAATLEKYHKPADFINPGQTSVEFLAALKSGVVQKGEKILLALGNLAPNTIQQELSKTSTVDRLDVYQTLPIETFDKTIMKKVWDNAYGLLVFSSPSAFSNFYNFYQIKKNNVPLRIVSIGEITTTAISTIINADIITSKEAGTAGLKKVIINYFKSTTS